MARDNDSSAFVLGMLLGSAAGVAVTLFTAPCSGEETIDGLRRRANRLLGRVEDAGTRAYDWATAPLKDGTPAGVYDWPPAAAEDRATGVYAWPAATPGDQGAGFYARPGAAAEDEISVAYDWPPAAPEDQAAATGELPQYVDASDIASEAEDLADDPERDSPA